MNRVKNLTRRACLPPLRKRIGANPAPLSPRVVTHVSVRINSLRIGVCIRALGHTRGPVEFITRPLALRQFFRQPHGRVLAG